MDIFVYSDESGVFDKIHQRYFIYGGLIFLSKDDKEKHTRKYSKAEKDLRKNNGYASNDELKASFISNKEKGKLYRSLNQCIKFGAVIEQERVHDEIYSYKKSKQRYMDYAFKISLKRALESLISEGKIDSGDVRNIYIHCDEHTTATNGRYELRESLEQEFKIGTMNYRSMKYFPPLFKNMDGITVEFCDSKSVRMIRAADIVANRIYYEVTSGNLTDECSYLSTSKSRNLYLTILP